MNLFDLVKRGKSEELKGELEESKDDINIRDNSNNYLIQYAIVLNNIDIVKILINKNVKLDVVDEDKRCLLYVPIKYGYYDILEELLIYNQNMVGISIIDIKDKDGYTPLHYAIVYDNIKMVKLLLYYGADVNIKNNIGFNSLHLAVHKKSVDICKLILDTNINVDSKTVNGETALHFSCNFQQYEITRMLLENNADSDITDYEYEISPIVYCIVLKNKKIFSLLLKYGVKLNTQDYNGNTPLHYTILDNNVNFFKILVEDKNINANVYNLNGKIPLHVALELKNENTKMYIDKLLDDSNVNLQNNMGYTVLHVLCIVNMWKYYIDKLKKKQLDLFVKNTKNKNVLDYVDDNDMDLFMDMVCTSFINQISQDINVYPPWDTLKNPSKAQVKQYIIENEISIPLKKSIDIKFDIPKECVKFTTFAGVTLDILIGLIFLLQKHNNKTCSVLVENYESNIILEQYYKSLGIHNQKTHYLNFEIVWSYYKLFFPSHFDDNIKKCETIGGFIIIPLAIELHNGNHANYIIYDIDKKQVERFEPNGAENPHGLNYNMLFLDNLLEKKFKTINENIVYVRPTDYLPKIGFQFLEIAEKHKYKKIGDPGGFCAAWTVWYVDMRLTNPEIPRKILVQQIILKIKKFNYSFKNIIRNYSKKITDVRDEILNHAQIDINEWINNQVTDEQINKVNNKIKNKIKIKQKRTIPKLKQGIIWVK